MERVSNTPRASSETTSGAVAPAGAPKLLDRVRQSIRAKHYSRRTESAYVDWIRRFIFHGKRHPSDMGASEVAAFLTWLATDRRVAASTQNQALSALLFLYRGVLHMEIGPIEHVPRARMPVRVPVVLSRDEVARIMQRLDGVIMDHRGSLVGRRTAAAGMLRTACQRHRSGATADRDSAQQMSEGPADPIANARHRTVVSPPRVGETPTRRGSRARTWSRRSSVRARTQVPQRGDRVGMAVRVSCLSHLHGSEVGATDPLSSPRNRRSEGGRPRRAACWNREARRSAHVQALVRDTPARRWVRHSDSAATARPLRCQHDDGVYARAQPRTARRAQPRRSLVKPSAKAVGPRYVAANHTSCKFGVTGKVVDVQGVDCRVVVTRHAWLAASARG